MTVYTAAVTVRRYDEPSESWGFHLLEPFPTDDFWPADLAGDRPPYRNHPHGLYPDADTAKAHMRGYGEFRYRTLFRLLKPEIKEFIIGQVAPLEWKLALYGEDPKVMERFQFWTTTAEDMRDSMATNWYELSLDTV